MIIINKMYSYRIKALFWLLLIFIAITILSGPLWKFWFIVPMTIFFWLIIDMMFFSRNMFMYEPNLQFWKEANEVDY